METRREWEAVECAEEDGAEADGGEARSFESLAGRVTRKRALSRRLLFLDVEADGATRPVVVKEGCGGVGGAAVARSVVKLGDVLRVSGEVQPGGSLLATHLAVERAWREEGGGAPWPPPAAVRPLPPPPVAEAAAKAASVCHAWLNTGQCLRAGCAFRHESAELRAEREAWVAARRERRLLLSAASDPTAPHEKRSHARRAAELSRWLLATLGRARLCAGAGVLDVAGGRGALSFELAMAGVGCTLVESREAAPTLDRRQRKRLRRVEVEAGAQTAEVEAGAQTAEVEAGAQTAEVEAGAQMAEVEAGAQMAEVEACAQAAEVEAGAPTAVVEAGSQTAGTDLPFRVLHESLDAGFEARHGDLVARASLLVGLHPDQATEPIVDLALRRGVPFAVVPCCVFAREMPKVLKTGEPVTTYEQLVEYLLQKAPGIRSAYLPFIGRNLVLWWDPSADVSDSPASAIAS
ncbi:hypothetical protein AB1Y20_016892 [Prymnesium parvum]|uniref:C3H1-type domain-containing protein n=1 Tax=Prymnesium parvum TaxID=97485 RepID=A0AB34IDP1_PRYPA